MKLHGAWLWVAAALLADAGIFAKLTCFPDLILPADSIKLP